MTDEASLAVVSRHVGVDEPDDTDVPRDQYLVASLSDPELEGELTAEAYEVRQAAWSADRTVAAVALARKKSKLLGATDERVGPRGRLLLVRPADEALIAVLLDDVDVGDVNTLDVGRSAVVAGYEATLHVWNLDGEPLWEQPGDEYVLAAAVSPAALVVAVGRADGSGNITSGPNNVVPFTAHAGPVHGVAWNGEGTLVATGGDDSRVAVWQPLTGDLIAEAELEAKVTGVSFQPDGTIRAVCEWANVVVDLALS